MKRRPTARILILVPLATLVITSCPTPLTPFFLARVRDATAPRIVLQSPADGSSYSAIVPFRGTIIDTTGDSEAPGAVQSMSYEVLGTTVRGDIPFQTSGSFAFDLPTAGMSGDIVVRLHAGDWNGNTAELSVTLVDGGAVPSFRATPGNKTVTLSWDPVPGAASYTILFTRNDSVPSSTNGETMSSVSSPLLVSGLGNGALHTFRLEARYADGSSDSSDLVRAIPLSPLSLVPEVTGGFRTMRVSWSPVSGTEEYEVLRSDSADGPFESCSGVVRGSEFIDSTCERGRLYYYSVRPALAGAVASEASACRTLAYPSRGEEVIGGYDTAGEATNVAVSGDRAYVATGDDIVILDIADPASPRLLGHCAVPGGAFRLDLQGTWIYTVGYARTSLSVVDVSDPATPEVVFEFSDGVDTTTSVSAEGPVLCVSTLLLLHVFDISNPAAPQWVSQYSPAGGWYPYMLDVEIVGNSAFVGRDSFDIVDLSDPLHPVSTGGCPTPGSCSSVAVHGSWAAAACSSAGVQLIDVTNPTNPVLRGTFDTPVDAIGVTFSGDGRLLVADRSGGVLELDISDPDALTEIRTHDTPGESYEVVMAGNTGFVADGVSGLQALWIQGTSRPALSAADLAFAPSRVEVAGDRVLAMDVSAGVHVYPVGASPSGQPCARLETAGSSYRGMWALSRFALVTSESFAAGTLAIYDVADLDGIQQSTTSWLHSNPAGCILVTAAGAQVYVADFDRGFLVLDIADPAQPRITSVTGARDYFWAAGMDMAAQRVYVTSYIVVRTFDVSRPDLPRLMGEYTGSGGDTFASCAVSGTRLYVANGALGVLVLDVSNPSAPALLTTYTLAREAAGVRCRGNLLLVADGTYGVKLVDITDPMDPVLMYSIDTPGSATDVDCSGRYVFVADGPGGYRVYDLTPDE
jgi:hypothetical protein